MPDKSCPVISEVPRGMTSTPYTDETMTVVSAPGAASAKMMGFPGVQLSRRGNAVVTYL